jgi:hypothetical protein
MMAVGSCDVVTPQAQAGRTAVSGSHPASSIQHPHPHPHYRIASSTVMTSLITVGEEEEEEVLDREDRRRPGACFSSGMRREAAFAMKDYRNFITDRSKGSRAAGHRSGKPSWCDIDEETGALSLRGITSDGVAAALPSSKKEGPPTLASTDSSMPAAGAEEAAERKVDEGQHEQES